MLNCVIVDDEQHCIDLLSAMIQKKFTGRLTITATENDAAKAVELLQSTTPHLVFLDVEMPGCTGLQLLAKLPQRHFFVVFTTAHHQYALDAIKSEAVDYLLKPIGLDELEAAVEKCEKREALLRQDASAQQKKKLMLSTGKGTLVVETDDIIRIESNNNYSTIYFTNKPKILVTKTLKTFDEQLSDKGFFRVHQSHLVNLSHVQSIVNGEPGFILLSDGAKVEIARRRKFDFLKMMARS
ncbi:MAG TPA: LytTR family DNA-binding domain-containing protein [Flavisolibacter sp.]|nr:LytTR family DNA-binding domain-containing protein [Flavisolibacter sp.]